MVRALDDNIVSILNVSFSGCEQAQGNSGNAFLLAWAEQAAAQGISVTVSTGDSGPANCDTSVPAARFGFAVNGIASSPWTIAVGGTDFDVLPANFSQYVNTGSSGSVPYYRTAKSYIPEVPWNDSTTVNTSISANVPYKNANGYTNMAASGGGASSCVTQSSSGSCLGGYLKPSFQTSLTPNDSVRDLPDVSLFSSNGFDQAVWTVCADNVANEDSSTTYTDCQTTNGELTSSSTFSGYGGTSTSAPAFAGMLALVSQAQGGARLGQADFVLYQLAKSKLSTVFHDTTVGDNSVVCVSGSPNCGSNSFMTGYNATAGYDQASGLGSVDAAALVANWSSVSLASTTTTLNINGSAAALTAVHGTPLTFNATVTPSAASGVASIVDTANESPSGSLLGYPFAIPVANGSGSATYNGLRGGSYSVAARYGGDTSDAPSTSSSINVTITPENSAVAISGFGCFPPPLSTLCFSLGSGGNAGFTAPYGSAINLSSQISGTSADEVKNGTQGVATGTVTFASGSTILGTVPVGVANQVSWPTLSTAIPYIPAGSYNIVAQYSGDASFNPAVSPAIALKIGKGMAGTNVSSASNSIPWSGSTIITVDVDSLASAVPTGTVTLTANGSTLATISSFTHISPYSDIEGTATIQASQLAYGANIITATYSGDNNYNSSSNTVTVTVTSTPPIGFTLGSSGNIAITPGESTGASTISVTPSGGFTGQVNLSCAITSSPGAITTGAPFTCNVASSVTITSASAAATALTVNSPTNIMAGTYVVTVSGTNAATGVVMATTAVTVTVGPSYGFALNNNGDLTIADGDVITDYVQIAITAFGGFTGNINTTCTIKSAAPNPAVPPTCTFPSPEYIGAGEVIVATMYVNTTSSTTPGTYVFTATGTDAATGTVTASTSVNVTLLAYNEGYTLSNSGNITLASSTSIQTATITVTPFGGFTGQVNLTGVSLYLGGSSAHNAVEVNSVNSVTGVHVSTTLNVSAPSGVDFFQTVTSPVTITGTSPATATLTVTAVALNPPAYGFTLASSGNISVNPGATTGNTAAIALAPTGGFAGPVNLACAITTSISNPVDLPTCSIVSPVNISSDFSGASSVLTVNTTAPSNAAAALPLRNLFLPGGGVALGVLLFLFVPARRRSHGFLLALLAAVVCSATLGCGGSSGGTGPPQGGGTTPGQYLVTVTGSDGATGKLTANTTISVTVN